MQPDMVFPIDRRSPSPRNKPTIPANSSDQPPHSKNPEGAFDSISSGWRNVADSHRDEWLRLAAEGAQVGLWYWDEVNEHHFLDAKSREIFGLMAAGEVTLEAFYKALHPDDHDRVKYAWRFALEHGQPYDLEFRSLRPDGTIRWVHARGKGFYDEAGRPLYMVGVDFDVTERTEAERERAELSGRLINAQEEERARLAREIHDDFSQRLALLAFDLEFVRKMIGESPREATERLQQLQTSVDEIGVDLHALSHSLHSSILEYMGLAPAVQSYCAEMAKLCQIQIEVIENVPRIIPPGTALSLFRIVQEGLRNVIKHSHASRVDVLLDSGIQSISLTIYDNGVGFNLSDGVASGGIGIISMRERARMLGGTFDVFSGPKQGTLITIKVPLATS